ncbi:MAG: YkgJ family cysteine cluster protein [Proteobacteria bacterium]|nr:YkgJ family cysteine cluster protein [Pseudomonadota bacterium]MBU1585946.1 YkgJ family cysteine cluster protein [Pseudomonadota bacterium]MBU2631342.1 YkgJ family cysteine cluster protein [Pseudomonadota bacterium]
MDSEINAGDDIFECRQCGDCCNGFGGTYVTEKDILNISAHIKFDPKQFIARYCDMSGSRHVLTLGKDGCCIFFDKEKQCTIHAVKPYMCKAWPFIQAVIEHPENWNAMSNSCPGMKKNIPHKDLAKIVAIEKNKLDKSIIR